MQNTHKIEYDEKSGCFYKCLYVGNVSIAKILIAENVKEFVEFVNKTNLIQESEESESKDDIETSIILNIIKDFTQQL